MWIPHRVFIGNLSIVAAITVGLIAMVWLARSRLATAAAIVVPALLEASFLALIATRGMPLLLYERVAMAAMLTPIFAAWLLLAAMAVHGARRAGGSKVLQLAAGATTAFVAFVATWALIKSHR